MHHTRKVLSGLLVTMVATAGATIFVIGPAEAAQSLRRDVVAPAPRIESVLTQMQMETKSDVSLVLTRLSTMPHFQLADVSPTATMPMVATTTLWRYSAKPLAESTNNVTAIKVTTTTTQAVPAPPTKTAASSLTNFPLVEDSS